MGQNSNINTLITLKVHEANSSITLKMLQENRCKQSFKVNA